MKRRLSAGLKTCARSHFCQYGLWCFFKKNTISKSSNSWEPYCKVAQQASALFEPMARNLLKTDRTVFYLSSLVCCLCSISALIPCCPCLLSAVSWALFYLLALFSDYPLCPVLSAPLPALQFFSTGRNVPQSCWPRRSHSGKCPSHTSRLLQA